MPKGWFRPVAKISDCSGLPSAVIPRKTRMLPGSLSATKKSPFGAVRIRRGLSSPVAYCSTLKPGRTCGHAFFRARNDVADHCLPTM